MQIQLVDVIYQLLDDMGSGNSVSNAAKAEARLAIEDYLNE